MANQQLTLFVRRLQSVVPPKEGGLTDGQLLERFVSERDEGAFEVLMWRHGPMVLGVCGRLLSNEQDAEDVFQATFLALARKAASISRREALGGFLYTTAYRAALRARVQSHRHSRFQSLPDDFPAPRDDERTRADLRSLVDEEIARLPVKYRLPVVLVYLQGQTTAAAAQQLGCARGTICSRLSWARQRLRCRLSQRGLNFTDAALATALCQQSARAVSAGLGQAAVKAALAFAGQVTTESVVTPATLLAKGMLKAMFIAKLKILSLVVLTAGVLALGAGLAAQRALADKEKPARLAGNSHSIRLPAESVRRLGIQATEIKPQTPRPRVLQLPGALALDPERLARVRPTLKGEVVEFGKVEEKEGYQVLARPIRVGDTIRKGQILAVMLSQDLAEKKGELVDALSRLELSRTKLSRMEQLFKQGVLPEVQIDEARRELKTDENAAARAEAVLRLWKIPQTEIKAFKETSKRIFEGKDKRDAEKEKDWGRLAIRSPLDGTVVEKNVSAGEVIVDTTQTLFTIANLDRLRVITNVAEADLPALAALPKASMKWTVQTVAGDSVEGKIDEVGVLIDPNQHTAVVKGWVDNPGHKLRAGQFITASIKLSAEKR